MALQAVMRKKGHPSSGAKAAGAQRQAVLSDGQLSQARNTADLSYTPLLEFLQEKGLVTRGNLWHRSQQTFSVKCHIVNILDCAGHAVSFHKYSAVSLEHESRPRQSVNE